MSTNFNWRRNVNIPVEMLPKKIQKFAQRVKDACADKDFDDERMLVHIGKRSMAGYYCFDCGTTLNTEGTKQVHSGHGYGYDYDACPVCGGVYDKFDKKGSVKGCCSFTWTLMAHFELIKAMSKPAVMMVMQLSCNGAVIEDEYGSPYTAKEMLKDVKSYPIWFQLPCSFS